MKKALALLITMILVAGMITGCGQKQEEAADLGPIKIGAVFSVTGGAAKLGGPEKNAAEMIVEEINAAGGVLGRQIELIVEDDEGIPENTVNDLQKLINLDEVCAIIGPTRSGNAIASGPICEEAGIPLVSCAAAWVQLFPGNDTSQPNYKYVFKTPQNDSHCARTIFTDCKAKGYTKVAIITGTTGFGSAGRAELLSQAEGFGIEIIADESYPPTASDLTPQLTKIKAQKPQALINWSIVPAQGLIAGQVKQLGLDVQLYQSHGFGNKGYIQPAAEGILFPAGRLLVLGDIEASHVQRGVLTSFKEAYEAKFGEEVSTFAGHAYDAIHMLVNAIETAGSTDKDAIRNALEAQKNFVGTAGVFNMSATDHCGLTDEAFVMVTVKDQAFRLAQ